MFDVGRDLPAESAGILLAEVDLVLQAAYPEPQRLHCWASIKVVFEFYSDPLRHRGLHDCVGYLHRTRSTVIPCSPRRRPPTRNDACQAACRYGLGIVGCCRLAAVGGQRPAAGRRTRTLSD